MKLQITILFVIITISLVKYQYYFMLLLFIYLNESELKYFYRDVRTLRSSSVSCAVKDAGNIKFDRIVLLYDDNLLESLVKQYENRNDQMDYEIYDEMVIIENFANGLNKGMVLLKCFEHFLIIYLKTEFKYDIGYDGLERSFFVEFVHADFVNADFELDTKNFSKEYKSMIKMNQEDIPYFYFYNKDKKYNQEDNKTTTDRMKTLLFLAGALIKNIYCIEKENTKGFFLTLNINDKNKVLTSSLNALSRFQDSIPITYEIPESFKHIMTRNKETVKIIRECDIAAKTDDSILLLGETGTGKELFARGIHKASYRNQKEFIALNCGAIPKDLLESELFGHIKGAFTGSFDKQGLFEAAKGGTVFLDEIGELPFDIQSKLLRVIQEKKFRKVGSTKEIDFNARIISATNVHLLNVLDKKFRSDLYYRISTHVMKIPSLAQRGKEDVDYLIEYFLNSLYENQPDNYKVILNDNARNLLVEYNWPGNIRQLESVLKRAYSIAIYEDKDIDEDIIKLAIDFDPSKDNFPLKGIISTVTDEYSPKTDNSFKSLFSVNIFDGFELKQFLEVIEIEYIKSALQKAKTQKAAGDLIGYSQQLLNNKIKKFKL